MTYSSDDEADETETFENVDPDFLTKVTGVAYPPQPWRIVDSDYDLQVPAELISHLQRKLRYSLLVSEADKRVIIDCLLEHVLLHPYFEGKLRVSRKVAITVANTDDANERKE